MLGWSMQYEGKGFIVSFCCGTKGTLFPWSWFISKKKLLKMKMTYLHVSIIGPNHYIVLALQDACASWLKDLNVQPNYQLQNCTIIQPCLMSIVNIWLQVLTTLNNLFTWCPYKTLTILNPLLTYLNSLHTQIVLVITLVVLQAITKNVDDTHTFQCWLQWYLFSSRLSWIDLGN